MSGVVGWGEYWLVSCKVNLTQEFFLNSSSVFCLARLPQCWIQSVHPHSSRILWDVMWRQKSLKNKARKAVSKAIREKAEEVLTD